MNRNRQRTSLLPGIDYLDIGFPDIRPKKTSPDGNLDRSKLNVQNIQAPQAFSKHNYIHREDSDVHEVADHKPTNARTTLKIKSLQKDPSFSLYRSIQAQRTINNSMDRHNEMSEKEKIRVLKLKKVRENAVQLAEKEFFKFHQKLKQDQSHHQRMLGEQKIKQKADIIRIKHLNDKLLNARKIVSTQERSLEKQALTNFSRRLSEIESLRERRMSEDRTKSFLSFQNDKSKAEEQRERFLSQTKYKAFQDLETMACLDKMQSKIERGSQNATMKVKQVSQNASKRSPILERARRNFDTLLEQSFCSSNERSLIKDSKILATRQSVTLQHSARQKHIKSKLSARSTSVKHKLVVLDRDTKQKHRQTMEKFFLSQQKVANLKNLKSIESQKLKEINNLRSLDVQKNLYKEVLQKKLKQSKLVEKMQMIDFTNRQIEKAKNQNIQDKVQVSLQERAILQTINPSSVRTVGKVHLNLMMSSPMGSGQQSSQGRKTIPPSVKRALKIKQNLDMTM